MYSSLLQSVQDAEQNYSEEKDRDLSTNLNEEKKLTRENVFGAGQSKRIWNELYKVIDSSDVYPSPFRDNSQYFFGFVGNYLIVK
jgi:hypothetical protein